MTLVLDGRSGPGSVHVLIVGVGHHDGEAHEDLPGVAAAVERLVEWWGRAEARLLEGRSLGTIRVLLSPEDGAACAYDPPTREAVCGAFEGWVTACEDAGERGMGFLFWVGHGGMIGSPGGPGHILYCTDWVSERRGDGYQSAVNWTETLQGINARCGQARVFCFIDSCRSAVPEPMKVEPALQGYRLSGEPRTFVLYSARPGGKAWSVDEPHEPSRFPGGPFATCATLEALDRFGAADVDPSVGHAATPAMVQAAVKHRVERWVAWLAAEEEAAAPPPVRIVHDQGDWFDEPMLMVASPAAMVDVLPEVGEELAEGRCAVRGRAFEPRDEDAEPGEHPGNAMSTGTHWATDTGRGPHRVRVWKIAGGEPIFDQDFYLSLPYHRLSRR